MLTFGFSALSVGPTVTPTADRVYPPVLGPVVKAAAISQLWWMAV